MKVWSVPVIRVYCLVHRVLGIVFIRKLNQEKIHEPRAAFADFRRSHAESKSAHFSSSFSIDLQVNRMPHMASKD